MSQPNVDRVLDFWEAYDRVNALPDSWYETSTICQQLSMLLSLMATTNGHEMPLQPRSDFMPPRWVPPIVRTKVQEVTDDEVAERLDRALKVRDGR